MMYSWDAEPIVEEELYAHAIGREILRYVKDYDQHLMARQIDSDAICLLKEIQKILDDKTRNDSDCFYAIDAIVDAFHAHNLSTDRHIEVEG